MFLVRHGASKESAISLTKNSNLLNFFTLNHLLSLTWMVEIPQWYNAWVQTYTMVLMGSLLQYFWFGMVRRRIQPYFYPEFLRWLSVDTQLQEKKLLMFKMCVKSITPCKTCKTIFLFFLYMSIALFIAQTGFSTYCSKPRCALHNSEEWCKIQILLVLPGILSAIYTWTSL